MRARMLVLFAAVLGSPLAHATSTDVIAGPGSGVSGRYSTVVASAQPGDAPRLWNLDLAVHSVEALSVGSDARPWCGPLDPNRPEGPTNPRAYSVGKCPLFWATSVANSQSAPILGLDGIAPGSYAFSCALFPQMRGLLVVNP